ncbi:HupE/UreJ family protein [Limibaculum sp. FT325]|uniref:HupE/UreJ family protein n=1 Tax=Thermohalobaculum sediminis TaxID=2939436 RepID=UPI0020BEABCE|nr:HupE/UreJ family protein [Limibaculum sediminis]MCL5779265.1 HupE/UreJ family protein [Limibaculum sediminis]
MRRLLVLSIALLALMLPGTVLAHFKLNMNVRIFHVVHGPDGLDIFLRTPMSYLVADKVGPSDGDGPPAPAPFTDTRMEGGVLMHTVAADQLRADPNGLGQFAADSLRIETEGRALRGDVVSVRVHPIGMEPGFATREEAERALGSGSAFPADAGETYVGDAVADIHLHVPAGAPVGTYRLSTTADPGLPGQEDTANLVLDHRGDATRTYRATGLMSDPIELSGSVAAAASTFVIEGARHILEGVDHVLFVICMVIGAQTFGALLARVSGFTVGHTVTLIMGFFGLAPSAPWFIPAVETAIALSIIYAAADAMLRTPGRERGNLAAVAVTAAIGLLHGFGFSFMLREILSIDAGNVWQSLLAFNVGVEFGQLAIVALVWPAVIVLRRMPGNVWIGARGAVALSVSAIASVWVIERSGAFLG